MPHVNDLSDQALFHGDLIANRRAIVRALYANGGGLTSTNGRATSELFELAGVDLGNDSRSDLMKSLEADGWLLRDVRGKRTYEIVLCDDHPAVDRLLRFFEADKPDLADDDLVTIPDPGDPEYVIDVPRSSMPADVYVHGPSADEVATAILRKVATLLDAEPADPELERRYQARVDDLITKLDVASTERDEYSARLSATVEENQRLRRMHREAGDELGAVKQERDQLRRDKRQLEDNLKALARNSGSEVDYEVRRRIEAFMRQTPTMKGD